MIAMPDPATFRMLPRQSGEHVGGAHVLRRAHARRRAVRGRLAGTCCAARSTGCSRWASTASRSGPSSSSSYFRLDEHGRPHTLDAGGYFEDTTRGRRGRPAQGDRAGARGDGHPGRVPAPRGRPQPARDRHPLRRRAGDGRPLHDLPLAGQGGGPAARRARHLHAQAAVRRERLGHAHPPVAVHRRLERVLRRRRPLVPVRRGQELHRRPAAPRPRDLAAVRAVGEQLQAAGAGLRGAGVRRLVAAQPLGADPGAAVPPRQGEGDPGRDPLPRSRPATRTWPSPGCCTPGWRGSSAATSCPTRWRPTSTS